ncbi:Sperm-associated antigen 17 [Cichlidogyrus casuarinus]|uniref:Sperm-associated antigen 17 n=1 Tax=Cichlidogyrus casuarinus TaxID=1844966 RepID=A0ABD2QBT9_9PLAT
MGPKPKTPNVGQNDLQAINEIPLTEVKASTAKGKKPTKGVVLYQELWESAFHILNEQEELNSDLLARLIKAWLLELKANEAPSGGAIGDDKGKSRKNSGKKKPDAKPTDTGKKEPKLLKRGEESKSKFINDEPENGIDCYVILYGFNNLILTESLAKIKVEVCSFVRLNFATDEAKYLLKSQLDSNMEASLNPQDPELLEEHRQMDQLKDYKMKNFWMEMVDLLEHDIAAGTMKNVASVDFALDQTFIPPDIQQADLRDQFGLEIFKKFSSLVYDLIDYTRQWKNYLNNQGFIQIPTPTLSVKFNPTTNPVTQERSVSRTGLTSATKSHVQEPSTNEEPTIPSTSAVIYLDTYKDIVSKIPHGKSSPALMLHAILEQALANASQSATMTKAKELTPFSKSDFEGPENVATLFDL